ncbi:MAG TPA: ABC transporter permease [Clostridiales bacterium]|nr:ABC transporter permease [Clostridiales bacterium]
MFSIIIKETREFIREKTNLFFFLVFPVVLVFLLGTLLGSMDQAEETVGEIKLQYIIETEDPIQRMAIEKFIETTEEEGKIFFEESNNLSVARGLASKDDITAVLVFTKDPLKIEIYEGRNHIKNRAVSALMNSFIQMNQTVMTIMNVNPEQLMDLEHIPWEENLIQKDLGVNRTMIDYYAIVMIAMISFMSIILGCYCFLGERQSKTLNRLIISPQSRVYLFLQKILGMVPQVVLQISIIMVISVFAFNANYARTFKDNLYLFFMFLMVTMALISIGVVIGLVIKKNPMVVLFPFLWIMMFLGGTFSKEVHIKGLSEFLPTYQVQQGAFDLAIFGRYHRANIIILISSIILVLSIFIGVYLFRRKEGEQ